MSALFYHVQELWRLFDFATNGNLFGPLKDFKEKYEQPIVQVCHACNIQGISCEKASSGTPRLASMAKSTLMVALACGVSVQAEIAQLGER